MLVQALKEAVYYLVLFAIAAAIIALVKFSLGRDPFELENFVIAFGVTMGLAFAAFRKHRKNSRSRKFQ